MAEELLRNGPVDKRRLDAQSRQDYSPAKASNALSLVKGYQAQKAYYSNTPPNTTQQKPGSGGFQMGAWAQAARQNKQTAQEQTTENYRPEIDPTKALELKRQQDEYEKEQKLQRDLEAAVSKLKPGQPLVNNTDSLKEETKGGKYF